MLQILLTGLKNGGKVKMVKLSKMILISLLMTLLIGASSIFALEMPDMSINSAFMYSLVTKTIEVAPEVDITLVTAFDGILRGNIAVVFPASDGESTQGNFMGGPMIKIDFVKLLAKNPKIIILKEFQLDAGVGVMFDMFHVNGLAANDLKKVVYPTISVGFRF